MASEATPKVSVRNIVKRFGVTTAANDISLDIRNGEFVTLLGESGCGKTTLMRIVAGLESPDSGSIWIDGVNVTPLAPRQRNVGMVFQQYSLFPHLSVAENIAYGLRVKRRPLSEIDATIDQMLDLVQLPGIRDRRPSQLSGGQQQRIALARALATRPTLLMLDEPLGALDLKLRRQLQGDLKRIHRESGATFLFVTHDQDEALFLSDRVAVMRAGNIEQLDDPIRIYQDPVNRFVADFVGEVTLVDCTYDPAHGGITLDGNDFVAVTLDDAPSKITLVVRPENAILRSPSWPVGLPVTVEDIVYQAGTTLYTTKHRSGALLKSRALGAPSPDFRRGTAARVTLSDCRVAFPR